MSSAAVTARYRGPIQYLPFGPLWDFYARHARSRHREPSILDFARCVGVDPTTVHRWRNDGQLMFHPADRAAHALDAHPIHVWGDAYLTVPQVETRRRRATVDGVRLILGPMRRLRAAAYAESARLRTPEAWRHVAAEALSQLVLDEADDAAYRRVCERKGLLPL